MLKESLSAVLKRSSVRFAHMRYRLPNGPFGTRIGLFSVFLGDEAVWGTVGVGTS